MSFQKTRVLTIGLLALVFAFQHAGAETVRPLAINKENVIKLSDHSGKRTFFEVMTMDGGIRKKLDAVFTAKFKLVDSEAAVEARNKFTPKVFGNVLRDFSGNQSAKIDAFEDVVDDLQGTHTNGSLKAALKKKRLVPWSIADFLSMASGAAVLVQLDDDNYYYNVSYEADEVNSGRSFGAGPSHKADDASYPFYLRNLRAFFDDNEDLSGFYTAMMEVLTQSDPSSIDKMDSDSVIKTIDGKKVTIDGQTLLTDFITVYTAELYRHINSDMKKHDWENALAELTFLSSYAEKANLVQQDGEIVDGTPSDWRYQGEQGSGIGGKSGINRRSFQRKVCKAARDLKVKGIETIDEVTGRKPDCFNAVMKLLNNFSTQGDVKKNAKKLTTAVVQFLGEIRSKSTEITAKIPGAR